MRLTYAGNHGDADWDWRPPGRCDNGRMAGGRFTDSALREQATGVRVVYIEEARARIDGQRNRFGLGPFVWTDPVLVPGVTLVKAAHINELRLALRQAYAASAREAPLYRDDPLVTGVTLISESHLSAVRAAIVALEQADE